MIDQVLGFNRPVVRKRRGDATSDNSNKQEVAAPITMSPARPGVKKLNSEETNTINIQKQEQQKFQSPSQNTSRSKIKTASSKPIQRQEAKSEITSDEKPEPRVQRKKQTKSEIKQQSDEQMASPAVKHLKVAKFAKTADEMKASGRMRESIKPVAQNQSNDTMYKLKLLGFIIVSIFLILNAMTPSRKGSRRK